MQQAEHCLTVGATLGEGPIWVDDALWFVDIKQQRIYATIRSRAHSITGPRPKWSAGSCPPSGAASSPGLSRGRITSIPQRAASSGWPRSNASARQSPERCVVDGQGRIWFGTMDNDETSLSGRLFQWAQGLSRRPRGCGVHHQRPRHLAGRFDALSCRHAGQVILAHPILGDGTLGPATEFARFGDADGHPDGAICDAEGGVWVGFFGGWSARRYGPDGVMTDDALPRVQHHQDALGGPDGRTAYATTARQACRRNNSPSRCRRATSSPSGSKFRPSPSTARRSEFSLPLPWVGERDSGACQRAG